MEKITPPTAMIEILGGTVGPEMISHEDDDIYDVIELTKDTITFLNSVKNTGVMESKGEESFYRNLLNSKLYFKEMTDMVMTLSRKLVDENMKLLNKYSSEALKEIP
jgi:hypothetical protein